MCGVAGLVGHAPDRGRPLLERLTAALAHRGPDGAGIRCFDEGVLLGHRRLSIVDLATGDQPMSNETGDVWITYNGEIYNHLELRRTLEAAGHRFHTRADSEVLVHGWEEWGTELFPRLNGIYAFSLYDQRRGPGQGVWLVRDPVGVKPLYLGHSGGGFWFASELAAAQSAGLVPGALRAGALGEFLVYRFVPSPGTFYEGVWKVPPRHFCRLPASPGAEPEFQSFAPRFAPAAPPRSRDEWEEAIRDGLDGAVNRQLMSDVPVGSLLSGGVDSTVVTGLMRDHLPDPPQAFAVGFPEAGALAELPVARRAAAALRVPLREVELDRTEYLAAWPAQAAMLGEPIANTGLLMVGLLCRTVRQTHKVVLSGQGADEPLGGYARHAAERWYRWTRHVPGVLARLPERLASSDRVARLARAAGEADEARRYAEILAVFSPEESAALRGAADAERLVAPVRRWLPAPGDSDSLNRLLRVDARLSLADDLLTVADHMAMASSVELRVPFLDLPLLGLLEAMPGRYKVSVLGERKWLYRRAVRPLLPASLHGPLLGWRERTGPKLGFSTPLDAWYRGWLRAQAEDYLVGPQARLPGWLQPARVREVVAEARDRGRPRQRQLLALYTLETWLRSHT